MIVRHPSFSPVPLPNVAGFSTFRSVVNAGSFEGQTTYGLGVRARLPFRVFTIDGRARPDRRRCGAPLDRMTVGGLDVERSAA